MDKITEIAHNYDAMLSDVKALSDGKATLVLASKTVEADLLKQFSALRPGVIYGENKVQELLAKYFVSPDVEWQFIGRLQTNKVKYIVDKVTLIQSVDSLRLAEEIEKRSAKLGKVMNILVEVNVGGEENKGGVSESELFSLLDEIKKMPHLRLKGLMSVLPNAEEGVLRPLYQKLVALYHKVEKLQAENFEVEYLSAGMSGDYKIALQCGSNMVRVGSAVFGARHYTL